MEHLTGIKAASQNIAACMKSPANVRAQMVAEMGHKTESAQYTQLVLRMKSWALLRLVLRVNGLALRPRRGTSKGNSLDL